MSTLEQRIVALQAQVERLTAALDEKHDEFVPDPLVCKEFHITAMTLWRWDQDDELEFPPQIKIRKKNYRSRLLLEQFKQQVVATAIAARKKA
jgi:hypothetical protein